MLPFYTKENIENYITRIENQKEALQISTLLTKNELEDLTETYRLQKSIATKVLIRLNQNGINKLDVTDALQL